VPVSFRDPCDAWNVTKLSYDHEDWAIFPTNLTKVNAIITLLKDKCFLGVSYLRPWGIKGQRNTDPKLKKAADYINATLTFKLNKNFDLQVSGYNLTGEDHPWWGPYTYDGVSRDINPNPEYFIRLIGKF
jgi:outer membrane receptor protein involved in Fe transport